MNLSSLSIRLFFIVYCVVSSEAEDWLSRRYRETYYNEQFILRINIFNTVDNVNDNGPVELSIIDQTQLLERCNGQENCIQNKEISIQKYKTKMEALQCINGVIVHYLLINWRAERLENIGSQNNHDIIYHSSLKMKLIMSRMLATLYRAKTFAHNWLWTLYIQLMAAQNWPYVWLTDGDWEYSQYENDLLSYIGICQENSYLPMTTVRPSESKAFYDSIVTTDIDFYIDQLYGLHHDRQLTVIYDFTYLFEIDYFVLADFFHRDSDVFGSFKKETINWGSSKARLKSNKSMLAVQHRTDEWRRNPFICIEYHNQIMRVIKIKTYYHTWLHLTTFVTILSRAEMYVGEFNLNVSDQSVWDVLCYHVTVAAKEFHSEDIVLYSIMHHLCTDVKVFDRKFLRQVRSMVDSLKEIISNDFTAIGVTVDEIRSNFDVTSKLSSKTDTIKSIFKDLILLGANETDIHKTLYGDRDTPQNSEMKTMTNLQFDDIDTAESNVQRENQSYQQLKHALILMNEKELVRYAKNFNQKMRPLDYFYMLFFSSGIHDLNTTFFKQNPYTTQYE